MSYVFREGHVPKPVTVPCFPLAAVLSASQLEIVKPFLRATFTETWKATTEPWTTTALYSVGATGRGARNVLRSASGLPFDHPHRELCTPEEGREIERLLYAKATRRGVVPVLGPQRSQGPL
jgi:hypothetical protein